MPFDFAAILDGFNITQLIGSMLSMISALLGKDRKFAEQHYFQKIADFFLMR